MDQDVCNQAFFVDITQDRIINRKSGAVRKKVRQPEGSEGPRGAEFARKIF